MRILFLGDIMGRAAREAVIQAMPRLRNTHHLDFVIVNGENSAGGFGITSKIADALFDSGVDVITTGNHVFDQTEVQGYLDREPRILRPINFPNGTVGRGVGLFSVGEKNILVVNAMGQLFMESLDCPFERVERELANCPLRDMADAIIVDFHAEASSEKMAMGHHCDGKATLVVGTHTHVPTADTQILPNGTAYQTDAGMCGDYDSVIGMQKDEPLNRFVTKMRNGRMQPADGPPTLCGVIVETDERSGLAKNIVPFREGGRLARTH